MAKNQREAPISGGPVEEQKAGELPFGSPKKWLTLAGSLTSEEADQILASVEEFEKVKEAAIRATLSKKERPTR